MHKPAVFNTYISMCTLDRCTGECRRKAENIYIEELLPKKRVDETRA